MAGLLKRLKDVVSAEAHELIDSSESPERIARQLVREGTEKVEVAQKLTIEAVTSEKKLGLQLKEHSLQLEKAQAAAELALKNGDEVNARRSLENKLHQEKLIETLEPQLQRAKANSESLKKQLTSLQQKLNSLKSEQVVIEARFKGATATGKVDEISADITLADDTQSRLDRANSMVSALEARNEAVAEVNAATNPDLSVNTDNDIEIELEKLRQQIKD